MSYDYPTERDLRAERWASLPSGRPWIPKRHASCARWLMYGVVVACVLAVWVGLVAIMLTSDYYTTGGITP